MDIQLKRGFLDICVLAVLQRGDSYGYQIIKDISPYMQMSESTLYPILKRLEQSMCVNAYGVEHNSRLRKYYKILPAGAEKIAAFVEDFKEMTSIYDFINGGMTDE